MRYKKLLPLLIIILVLNLIWEFFHYFLYIDLTGISPTWHLIGASFVDVLLVTFLFALISLFRKKISWIKKPLRKDYILLIILGLILAFIWELINLSLGRWQYTESMPTIFNVGLSPLLQLAVTGSLGLKILKIKK